VTAVLSVDDTVLRVLDQHEIITVVARTTRRRSPATKAYMHTNRAEA
jgi:hypothetical protein